MECNRDEAAGVKELAEMKFMAKDTIGAKKFALKAQRLFPGLESILQMSTTLDVYISAEKKFDGETDFYGVPGVDSRADEDTVRKQYRKLALVLHPDKNKSIGAEAAFKLISEAWSLLSDKARRTVYDQKRYVKANKKVSNPNGGPSAHPGSSDCYHFTKCTTPNERTQKGKKRYPYPPAHSSPQKPKPTTFWTVFSTSIFEFIVTITFCAPVCHKPFFAIETPPPPSNGSNFTIGNFTQLKQNPSNQTAGPVRFENERNNESPTNVGIGESNNVSEHDEGNFHRVSFSRTPSTSAIAHAASMVQQAYAKVKREQGEARAATKRVEALQRKDRSSNKTGAASSSGHCGAIKRTRSMDDIFTTSHKRNITSRMGLGNDTGNLFGLTKSNAESNR